MLFIELLKAFVFGIVEGVTEWLPVSSTGHMILLESFVKLDVSDDFWNVFLVVIQLGAIIAVVLLFFNKLWPFKMPRSNSDSGTSGFKIADVFKADVWVLWFKIAIACLPAAIVGILFDDDIDRLFMNPTCVTIALIFYGIVFIVIERREKNKNASADRMDSASVCRVSNRSILSVSDVTFRFALFVGVFQLLALIPGTSRSGATIIGGLLLGASRSVACEFTFFLAVPVMLGASLLKVVKFGFDFTSAEYAVLAVGCLTAFFVSLISIKFLMNFVKKHDFTGFGIYRVVLGVIVGGYFILA